MPEEGFFCFVDWLSAFVALMRSENSLTPQLGLEKTIAILIIDS